MESGVKDKLEATLGTLKAAQPCVKTEHFSLFPIILISLTLRTHNSDAAGPFFLQKRLSP
jgi:hypothetical protein